MKITLQEITEDTLDEILALDVTPEQKKFVAPNAVSIAQAHYSRYSWFRAIYDDDTPVGFVMLYLDGIKPHYSIWRFMIDKSFQGKGIGREALKQVIEFVNTLPESRVLSVSYAPGKGDPSGFYAKQGFVETGLIEDDENIMNLDLT